MKVSMLQSDRKSNDLSNDVSVDGHLMPDSHSVEDPEIGTSREK